MAGSPGVHRTEDQPTASGARGRRLADDPALGCGRRLRGWQPDRPADDHERVQPPAPVRQRRRRPGPGHRAGDRRARVTRNGAGRHRRASSRSRTARCSAWSPACATGATPSPPRPTGTARDLRVTNHDLTGPVFSGRQQRPVLLRDDRLRPRARRAAAVRGADRGPLPVPHDRRRLRAARRPVGAAGRSGDGHRGGRRRCPTSSGSRPAPSTARCTRSRRSTTGRTRHPTRPQAGWNGRLVYTFGGGCNGGYHQGAATGGVLNDLFLSRATRSRRRA